MVTIPKLMRADLLNKLLVLKNKFHFRIQGDEIEFGTNASTSDFIAELEKEYRFWGKLGKKGLNFRILQAY